VKKLVLLLVLLSACASGIPIETGPPVEAHFCPRDDCVGLLVGKLGSANDAACALYRVTQPEVLAALEDVAWVTDEERSGPLMHNKFCVFDEEEVWTGSWNPTQNNKADNVVIIRSKTLAENYLEEFDELPGGYWRVKNPVVSYNNRLIENYFCPDDDCRENVLEELQAAKQEIVFLLSWITDDDIIAQLQRDDVIVEGVIDKSQKEAIAALPFAHQGSVHHKAFIIDGQTVITGSYNPTKSGDNRNDENILIIHDPGVAREFLEEYEWLTTLSTDAS
jgi:phosphatidylserine/phosphatidylglycerophosphate/cardiolipin synthase-like enzyme